MRRLRQVAILTPLILAAGLMTYLVLDGRQKRQREEQQFRERVAAVRQELGSLIAEAGADFDWEARLVAGGSFAPDHLVTLDLERVWLTSKPILFTGRLADLATADSENYRVIVEHDFSSRLTFVLQRVRMETTCPRATLSAVDSARKGDPSRRAAIAVVVKVRGVRLSEGRSSDTDPVFTGSGDCLSVRYIPDGDLVRWATADLTAQ